MFPSTPSMLNGQEILKNKTRPPLTLGCWFATHNNTMFSVGFILTWLYTEISLVSVSKNIAKPVPPVLQSMVVAFTVYRFFPTTMKKLCGNVNVLLFVS